MEHHMTMVVYTGRGLISRKFCTNFEIGPECAARVSNLNLFLDGKYAVVNPANVF